MLWNGRGSWKLRATPAMRAFVSRKAVHGAAVEDERCRSRSASVPQMQLTSVLLPEPFGPIRPSRSPGWTSSVDAVERDEAAEALADVIDVQ